MLAPSGSLQNVQTLRTPRLKPFVIFIKPPSPERLRETRRDARILSARSASRAFTVELTKQTRAQMRKEKLNQGRKRKLQTASMFLLRLQEDDFLELEDTSRMLEVKYRHLFDRVLVNEDLHDCCMRLFSLIQESQQDPQWTPVSWSKKQA